MLKGHQILEHCSPNTLSYVSRTIRNTGGKTICQTKKTEKERKVREERRERRREGNGGTSQQNQPEMPSFPPTGSNVTASKSERIREYPWLCPFNFIHLQEQAAEGVVQGKLLGEKRVREGTGPP